MFVLLILLLSAVMHGVWNLLVKKSRDKQTFLWLALITILFLFFVPFVLIMKPFPVVGWTFIIISGTVEAGYYLLLGKAYQNGALSLVYPIARGFAPLFVTLFAVLFVHEHISTLGYVGIFCIAGGIYTVNLESFTVRGFLAPFRAFAQSAARLAVLTGLIIAVYSVLDKRGVAFVHPATFIYLKCLVTTVVMAPFMFFRKRKQAAAEWNTNNRSIIAVTVLLMSAYLLVLFAMTGTNVSYVSSIREVSIVFSALLGTVLLKEPFVEKKIPGAVLIVAGIILIACGK